MRRKGRRVGLIDEFVQDGPVPTRHVPPRPVEAGTSRLIDGVALHALAGGADARGSLFELLSARDGPIEPIVHVYQVHAQPGSVRAWVLHRHQDDRLAFISGTFRVVLFDQRPGSPSFGRLDVLDVGQDRPCLLRIPRFVIHGVQNRGEATASFVNMPTRVYDPADPDKWRLPADHPGIPYRF